MAKFKAKTNAELLSYIMNVEPMLREEIGLPVQGQDIAPIGKVIVNNERFKNAFINAVNVIGLTMIDNNYWDDPWENFTNSGYMSYGDSAREMAVDLAHVYDYNTYASDPDNFLENVVPNVLEYIHPLNYQKFYKTTTSEEQIAMAFSSEGGLLDLINEIISSLYEGYKYDKYIVNKYMLCRRILDGTVTSVEIANFSNLSARERVSAMKNVSNLMTFRSPNYNPAGLRIATPFEKQILIMNTDFESALSTEVLATSFFMNEADFKSRGALIDGFGNHDTARLLEVLGDQYVAFSSDELSALANVPACIIDDEWFQNKTYALDGAGDRGDGLRQTSFFNPETLRNNHWLHYWGIKSTSPFKNAVVFSLVTPGVTSVTVSPSSATVSKGDELKLSAIVTTTGFANKSVIWSVDDSSATDKVAISQEGLLVVPSNATVESITVTATSVYDHNVTGTATITVASSTVPSITSVTVSASGGATSITKGATLQLSATVVKVGNPSTAVTWSLDADAVTDGFTVSSTGLVTAPADATAESITVTATSIFDTTKDDDIELSVVAGQ